MDKEGIPFGDDWNSPSQSASPTALPEGEPRGRTIDKHFVGARIARPRAPFQGAADEGGWGLYRNAILPIEGNSVVERTTPRRFAPPPW